MKCKKELNLVGTDHTWSSSLPRYQPNFRDLNLESTSLSRKKPYRLLKWPNSQRSKVKTNWGDSSPEADNILKWQLSQDQGWRSSSPIWNHYPFLPICYLFFLSINAWADNALIRISQTKVTAGNHWICHAKPDSIHEEIPEFTLKEFAGIPNAIVCLNCSTDPFYKVKILNTHTPSLSLSRFNPTLGWKNKIEYI